MILDIGVRTDGPGSRGERARSAVARFLTTLALAAAASAGPAAASAQGPGLDIRVPVPPTPVVVDGVPRLVYELRLTGRAAEGVVLRRLVVRDARSGRPLLDARGETLGGRVAHVGATPSPADALSLAAGGRAVVYVELDLPAAAADAGRGLEHEIEFARGAGTETIRVGPFPLDSAVPPVLGPPVRGGPWVAVYHPSWPRGHRRVAYESGGRLRIPGRFAVDWILVDGQGRHVRGDADVVAAWLGYGEEVVAVADAVVVAVRDDVAESARLSTHPEHPLRDATGNAIALDLGDGRFAFYEHLKPGSIRVREGERVRRGEPIAALGFTGHSTGPHLHFHVADANSPLGAEGVPFTLACFDVLGGFEDIAALGAKPWQPRAAGLPARRRAELPAPNTVVDLSCGMQDSGGPDADERSAAPRRGGAALRRQAGAIRR